ncbi:efflux RND transporter periplasmic adaptor subunit [Lutibacter aestuarii]|uniref:Efflux RND transporter periplasmic adaptor subunit n=1 Tax=Lutibacter aestuarii TaxID=861111 RepID=A0ABW2Z3Q2_9FLAO
MKKYIIYIGILTTGLISGWLLFGNSSNVEENHNHETSQTENQQWTCSMHPQIMQPEPGDCPICGMDLIPAETSADGLTANEFKMSTNALALANIETTVIGFNTTPKEGLFLVGKIKENEKTNAIQTAHFGGRIEKLFVNSTGEMVTKGQPLALIYSPELVTAQKELLTASEIKNSDVSLYNAVKNKLKLWKLSENQIHKIEKSKTIITNFPVYANVTGVVSTKMVEEGTYIKEGQGLFTIANLTTVWANFDAYEKQLSSIQLGDEIRITTNANPNKEFKAKISFIDPILNTLTRTVTVRAELNNPKGTLKPGMFIKGFITPSNTKNNQQKTLIIPKSAVLWTGERSVVYVKKEGLEPVFEMREVTLGNEIGNSYEILDGLYEQEEIVTNGTFTIDAAAQLQGKKSMMNTKSGNVITGHENHIGMQETSNLEETTNSIEQINVPLKFQQQLHEVLLAYLQVKDALVNDNSNVAQKEASILLKNLQLVDMKLLTENKSHKLWMTLLNKLTTSAKEIEITNDIKAQRNSFISLSNNITKSVESFGANQKVYKQFCPMANSDKGAIWLSLNENIENPYYGEMMLKCGVVQATIE